MHVPSRKPLCCYLITIRVSPAPGVPSRTLHHLEHEDVVSRFRHVVEHSTEGVKAGAR